MGLNTGSNNDSLSDADQPSPLHRMRSFFALMYESCYHMLGSGCNNIGRDFYQLPGLANALLSSVFSDMEVSNKLFLLYILKIRKKMPNVSL